MDFWGEVGDTDIQPITLANWPGNPLVLIGLERGYNLSPNQLLGQVFCLGQLGPTIRRGWNGE